MSRIELRVDYDVESTFFRDPQFLIEKNMCSQAQTVVFLAPKLIKGVTIKDYVKAYFPEITRMEKVSDKLIMSDQHRFFLMTVSTVETRLRGLNVDLMLLSGVQLTPKMKMSIIPNVGPAQIVTVPELKVILKVS